MESSQGLSLFEVLLTLALLAGLLPLFAEVCLALERSAQDVHGQTDEFFRSRIVILESPVEIPPGRLVEVPRAWRIDRSLASSTVYLWTEQ